MNFSPNMNINMKLQFSVRKNMQVPPVRHKGEEEESGKHTSPKLMQVMPITVKYNLLVHLTGPIFVVNSDTSVFSVFIHSGFRTKSHQS